MPRIEASAETHGRPRGPARRQGERVSPLELFFDLVFVLAITQCTQLMADNPTWEGVGQGILMLAILWWSWVGYSWMTSVVDPDDGQVRAVVFVAMAGLLIASICIPDAYGDLSLEFAIAYGVVRFAQIGVFVLASADDPGFRRSTIGLGIGTAIGVGLLIAGSFLEDEARVAVWSLAVILDIGEPYIFGSEGWKLEPGHFAERHALILLIALGESIVAIGVGAEVKLDAGIAAAAAGGIVLTAALWWIYFDVVATVASRRLIQAEKGKEQNELARDSYSYLHFVMIAGIVLVALGLKKTIADTGEPLKEAPAFALLGGTAIYLMGHVLVRYRHLKSINRERLALAILFLVSVPLASEVDSLIVVGIVAALLWVMIAYETRIYGESRKRLQSEVATE